MKRAVLRVYENQTLHVDGMDLLGCELKNCHLVFGGKGGAKLNDCTLDGCTFQLLGAAADGMRILAAVYFGDPDRENAETFLKNTLLNAWKSMNPDADDTPG